MGVGSSDRVEVGVADATEEAHVLLPILRTSAGRKGAAKSHDFASTVWLPK